MQMESWRQTSRRVSQSLVQSLQPAHTGTLSLSVLSDLQYTASTTLLSGWDIRLRKLHILRFPNSPVAHNTIHLQPGHSFQNRLCRRYEVSEPVQSRTPACMSHAKSLHAIPFLEFLNIYTHVRKTVSAILPDFFSSYGECCICAAVLHCLRVDCMTVRLSYLEVIPCHCPWWQDIQEVICYSWSTISPGLQYSSQVLHPLFCQSSIVFNFMSLIIPIPFS